ncbi:unnamed protein product [Fraxinus pennsylvanica]|uniref:Uncharacterized protein n=1 Tax=Fraxinus pennsylvanica TaxID=56036 RepID=A0AAD2DTI6_9LAMI|nr:unnamed protein product [Fraxinus pennsylvanica]
MAGQKISSCEANSLPASSESGISAQIDHKAFLKGRARNSMKAPLMIKDRISFHSMKANIRIHGPQNQENRNNSRPDEENHHEWGSAVRTPRDGAREVDEETGIYRWVSGCTSSDEEKRDVNVSKSLICSGNSKNFNCSTEIQEHIRSSDANDNHITFCSSTKISGESENMTSIKGESVKMDPKVTDNINDGFLLHESSEFLMTKPTKVLFRDQSKSVTVFDLNEDINTNELDDGIDLNVAAVEDIPEIGFQMEDVWKPSESPFQDSYSEVDSRRAERLDIDLNCLCDDVDESPQSSLPAESRSPRLADLDLNADTSAGNACNNVGWQGQGSQPLESKAMFSVNSKEHDVNFSTPTYLPDLGSVNVFNHSHAYSHMMAAPNVLKQFEEMHRVSPLQPKLPYPLHMLPLQNYPSHGPLYIAPTKPFMFNIHYPRTIPCVRDPQLSKPETVPASLGIPRLVEVAHGQSRGDITSSIRRIDVKSENDSSTSVSKRDKAGEFTLPAKNSSMDENDQSVNQEACYAKLMKRKEPEGGRDCYHVGHRQVT